MSGEWLWRGEVSSLTPPFCLELLGEWRWHLLPWRGNKVGIPPGPSSQTLPNFSGQASHSNSFLETILSFIHGLHPQFTPDPCERSHWTDPRKSSVPLAQCFTCMKFEESLNGCVRM